MTQININDKLDILLNKLSDAHKIILDETNLMVIKLHDNDHFYDWAKDNNVLPTIKKYHTHFATIDPRMASLIYSFTAKPCYITLGIIPATTKKLNISCCNLDITRLGNIIFDQNSSFGENCSSGIIFNGSFYFLKDHIEREIYGIDKTLDIRGNKIARVDDDNSYFMKPIGYMRYDSDVSGRKRKNDGSDSYNGDYRIKQKKHKQKQNLQNLNVSDTDQKGGVYNISHNRFSYDIPYDRFSLEPPKIKNGNKILTLQIIKDFLGIAVFTKNGSSIKHLDEYKTLKNKIDSNVVMGNLLIYDNQIVMKEQNMAIAVLLIDVVDIFGNKLNMFDKIYLCDSSYNILSGLQIDNLTINHYVYFIGFDDSDIRGKIKYHYDDIFLPFCISLIVKQHSGSFNGKIMPGFPTHASDLNPRTCLMIDENNNTIVIQVEGRHTCCGGIGIDLFDLAQLCAKMGAVYAINLDGGGSSKMLWKEKYNNPEYVGLDKYDVSNAVFIVNNRSQFTHN